jgi:uridine kinase
MVCPCNGPIQVVHISQDSFYRELKGADRARAAKGLFNFDHPDAFDNALMERCLRDIMEGRPTKIPVYDFKSNCRVPNSFTSIQPRQVDVVLFEGILTFYNPVVSFN